MKPFREQLKETVEEANSYGAFLNRQLASREKQLLMKTNECQISSKRIKELEAKISWLATDKSLCPLLSCINGCPLRQEAKKISKGDKHD